MQETLVALNRSWAPGRQAGGRDRRSGINTGAMAVGNMGSAARFDYTVLGDQVNLGARLEALTKEYGVAILVGEATAEAAGDAFVFREIDLVRVKGRAGAAPVFELVGRAGARVEPAFATALAAYRRARVRRRPGRVRRPARRSGRGRAGRPVRPPRRRAAPRGLGRRLRPALEVSASRSPDRARGAAM